MNDRRSSRLAVLIALIAASPALGQAAAAPDKTGLGGARPGLGVPAGAVAKDVVEPLAGIRPSVFQSIVTDARPLGGVKSQPPPKVKGLVRPRSPQNTRAGFVKGLVGPRFPQNTRAGFIPIENTRDGFIPIENTRDGFVPIGPPVRSKAPSTNRFKSQAEMERERIAREATPPPPRFSAPNSDTPDQARRLREAVDQGDTGEVRRIGGRAIVEQERMQRRVDGYDRREQDRTEDECADGEGRAVEPSPGQPLDERILPSGSLESLTAREKGDRHLAAGDAPAAIDEYLLQLADDPDDADTARALAVALLVAERPEHAGKAALEAYRLDPALTSRAYDASALPADTPLRSLATRLANRTNNAPSPGGWLLAAALAQAEGRTDVAARFVERGRSAGLESTLADAFVASLAKEVSNGRGS